MEEIFNKSMDIASTGWIENNIAKFLRGDEKIEIFEQKSLKVAVRKERGRKKEEERNEALPIAKYIDSVLLEISLANAVKSTNAGWLQKDIDDLLISHLTEDEFKQKVNSTFSSKKMRKFLKKKKENS